MLTRTITYVDADNVEHSEECSFGLTVAEIKIMRSTDSNYWKQAQTAGEAKNPEQSILMFKKLIGTAYGQKSEDGQRLLKSPRRSALFMNTEAFKALFNELDSDPEAAKAFARAIFPLQLPFPYTEPSQESGEDVPNDTP